MEDKTPQEIEAKIIGVERDLEKTEKGLSQLEKTIQKHFTPEKIEALVVDLCTANDIKRDRNGEEYTTPNWEARKNGLDRVLGLLKYTKKDATPVDQGATKIVFQIVNNPPALIPSKSDEAILP